MSGLDVALIQTELVWHHAANNRIEFERHFAEIEVADLVILPEMFTTGFTMASAEQFETMDGPTLKWLQQQADNHQFAICGSLIIREENQFFNRWVLVQPNVPSPLHYDKKHLFRMANEHQHFEAGATRMVFELKGIRVCPQICYDLRFPVFSRNQGDYDCLLYVANWPAARRSHWRMLLTARAIENQCYVIGVNRIGTDGNNIRYSGDSGIIDPLGEWQVDMSNQTGISNFSILKQQVLDVRNQFPAWRDADAFSLDPDAP